MCIHALATIFTNIDACIFAVRPIEQAHRNQTTKRATRNLTGDHCSTICERILFNQYGPNENDCLHIINGLWSVGGHLATIAGRQAYYNSYYSCVVELSVHPSYTDSRCDTDRDTLKSWNTSPETLQYDYGYMGTVANYMRQNCNAAHNSASGYCEFDQSGFDREQIGDYPAIRLYHS